MSKYEYIGDGSFLPGIPARDLSEEEAEAAGLEVLEKSGLYRKAIKPKLKPLQPKKEDVNERINEAQEDSAGS